jgi:hypothetical protein
MQGGIVMPSEQLPHEDFALEAREINAFWKIAEFWWLVQKKYVLRKFVSTCSTSTIHLEMWNGDTFELSKDIFQATYMKNPQRGGERMVTIKCSNGTKIRIQEMKSMYPNGADDFNTVIKLLGAEETWLSKATGVLRKVEKIGEGLSHK